MASEHRRCEKPQGKAVKHAYTRPRGPGTKVRKRLRTHHGIFLKTAHFLSASIIAVAVKLRASETFYLNLTSLKLFILKRQLCGHTVPWWQRPNFDSSLERNYYKKPLDYCFVRKHLSWFMCRILYQNITRGMRNTFLTNHDGFNTFQSVKYLVNAAAQ